MTMTKKEIAVSVLQFLGCMLGGMASIWIVALVMVALMGGDIA